jgi:hypothetical protein
MFTHKSLLESCKNLELDPEKRGTNFWTQSWPANAFEQPIDLLIIDFPKEEKDEVLAIGMLINNLHSQIESFGAGDYKHDEKIKKFLSIAEEAQQFWFDKGLKKIMTGERKFILCNGIVYEIDPDSRKRMDEFNERAERGRRMSPIERDKWDQSRNPKFSPKLR